MKRGWLIGGGIAGGLVLLAAGIGAFIYFLFSVTQPLADASNDFLALLGQGKIAEAYASTADEYRAQQDEVSFTSATKQLGLTEYSSATWYNRKRDDSNGKVGGTVTTRDGGSKAVAIYLVHEHGKWKVASVRWGGVDLATIKARRVPPENELEQLVLESLLDFNEAVRAKDFKGFHAKVSKALQKEHSPESLQKIFQPFVDKKIDIASIKNQKPKFALPPTMTDQGALLLIGNYAIQPELQFNQPELQFNLTYVHEQGAWRLTGINVNSK